MKGFVQAGLAVALGLAVVAAPAQAQKKKPAPAPVAASSASTPLVWNAGVELGLPSTGATTGFGARVGVTLTPHGWPVWLRPDVSFDHFGIDCSGCGSITQIAVGADAGYDIKSTSSMKPYLVGGLNISHSSWSGTGPFSFSGTGLGIDIGGGVKVPVGSMHGYGELRYHSVGGTGGVDFIALTFGLLFGGK
ncbi:MAG: hypothetical protein WBC97_01425 [Gemmatimonadales bacterium]